MKTIKIILASVIFISAVFIISCKKSDTPNNPATPDTDVSGASDNTLAENTSGDLQQMGAETSDNNGASLNNFRMSNPGEFTFIDQCATVTRNDTTKTITIQFSGDLCSDGRYRTGKLILNFSSSAEGALHYRNPGFRFTVTSVGYTVDSNQVDIVNESVTNTTTVGFDSATTNETWVDSSSLVITKPNGNYINWNGVHTRTLLNTSTTYNGPNQAISWGQARVGRTGSASGSRSGGETFTNVINTQLVRDFGSCHPGGRVPFILGTFTYTASNKKYSRLVDYGYERVEGVVCDFWASVTINGIQYPILIP